MESSKQPEIGRPQRGGPPSHVASNLDHGARRARQIEQPLRDDRRASARDRQHEHRRRAGGRSADWIAPRQKIEFSFVLSLDGKQRALPTFGVVVRNDAQGLEVRYNAPALRWRDILARLISEDARAAAEPK